MQSQIIKLVALITTLVACHSTRPVWLMTLYESSFRLTVVPERTVVSVGSSLSIRYVLSNAGSSTIRACIWRVQGTLGVDPPPDIMGSTMSTVFSAGSTSRTPQCSEPIFLRPGEAHTWSAPAIAGPEGSGGLKATADLVYPESCTPNGCSHTTRISSPTVSITILPQ